MRKNLVGGTACIIFLASCGGESGGTPTPTPVPSNSAPTITSAAEASVAENQIEVLTVTATDPDADALTFSISGGDDAASFSISSGGVLNFVDAPDFENPDDADGDNVYSVIVSASDGALSDDQTITVTVTDAADQLSVVKVSDGCGDAILAGDLGAFGNEVLLACYNSAVRLFAPSTSQITTVADFATTTEPYNGAPTNVFWDDNVSRLYIGWQNGPFSWDLGSFEFDGSSVTLEGRVISRGLRSPEFSRGNWVGRCLSQALCYKYRGEGAFEVEIDRSGGGFTPSFTSVPGSGVRGANKSVLELNGQLLVSQTSNLGENVEGVTRVDTTVPEQIIELEFGGFGLHLYSGPVADLNGKYIVAGPEGVFAVDEASMLDGAANPSSDYTDLSGAFPSEVSETRPYSFVEVAGRTFVLNWADGVLYEIVGE